MTQEEYNIKVQEVKYRHKELRSNFTIIMESNNSTIFEKCDTLAKLGKSISQESKELIDLKFEVGLLNK